MNQNFKRWFAFALVVFPLIGFAQDKKIIEAEYFWDTDPGQGNGIALSVYDGNFDEAVETVFANTTSLPSEGNHKLSIRVRDVYNGWGPLFSSIIKIDEATTEQREIKITTAEFFWDTDPGQGSGTAMIVFDGNFDEAVETVFANATLLPSLGNHKLNIRMRDAENEWSSLFSVVILIDESFTEQREIKITSAEFFWDTDPGQGSGTAMIVFDGNFNEAVETVFTNTSALPSLGNHKLNIRVRDAENEWSALFSVVIFIDESFTEQREIEITEAEYFWDNDPGEGNATPLFAFDGNFDEAVETVIATATMGLTEGLHVLNVRMRDAEGDWSDEFQVVVLTDESTTEQREIFVAAGEYWFDADPGEGNATPVVAMDGNFNEVIEGIIGGEIPQPVTAGIHVLWIRAQDPQGGWGPPFGIVVNMDIDIGTFTTQISGEANICSGSEQLNVNYSCIAALGSTYTWTIVGGVILSGQGTTDIVVNWNTGGVHTLSLEQCLSGNCQTDDIAITIYSASEITNNIIICEGDSYYAAGANQTNAGVYVDALQTTFGCDSTVTTVLSVINSLTTNTTASICQGQNIFLGGGFQTQAGTYLDTFTAAGGCDSLVYTTLSVHSTYNQNVTVEICDGESYFVGGANQTDEGFYTDVFDSMFGCDSVVVTNLVVNDAVNTNQFVHICQGESFFAGGANQTTSGTYIDVLAGDCSETLTTYLTVHSNYAFTNNVGICSGQSYFAGGANQTASGTYIDNFETVFGCDSIVTTNLTVDNIINNNQYIDICQGESFFAGGANQTASGTYVDVIDNGDCNETLTTYLTVHANATSQSNVTICEGQSYFAGGALQTQAGVYNDVFETSFGCDSTVTTILNLTDGFETETIAAICEGQSIFLAGAWQTQAGMYTDLFESIGGCDSVVVTTLSLVNGFETETGAAICEGESILLGGSLQTQAGVYTDLFESIGGCDSVVVTTLSIHPLFEMDESATICEGDSIFLGGDWQDGAGIYVDQFETQFGCDSLVTTTLNITFIPATPSIIDNEDGTVTCSETADNYIWIIDGLGCEILTVETTTPTITLSDYCDAVAYEVSVTIQNGDCLSEESSTISIIIGIEEIETDFNFSVYPNPSRDVVCFDGNFAQETLSLRILDALGKTVFEESSFRQNSLNIQNLAQGEYWFVAQSSEGEMRAVKVMKQ